MPSLNKLITSATRFALAGIPTPSSTTTSQRPQVGGQGLREPGDRKFAKTATKALAPLLDPSDRLQAAKGSGPLYQQLKVCGTEQLAALTEAARLLQTNASLAEHEKKRIVEEVLQISAPEAVLAATRLFSRIFCLSPEEREEALSACSKLQKTMDPTDFGTLLNRLARVEIKSRQEFSYGFYRDRPGVQFVDLLDLTLRCKPEHRSEFVNRSIVWNPLSNSKFILNAIARADRSLWPTLANKAWDPNRCNVDNIIAFLPDCLSASDFAIFNLYRTLSSYANVTLSACGFYSRLRDLPTHMRDDLISWAEQKTSWDERVYEETGCGHEWTAAMASLIELPYHELELTMTQLSAWTALASERFQSSNLAVFRFAALSTLLATPADERPELLQCALDEMTDRLSFVFYARPQLASPAVLPNFVRLMQINQEHAEGVFSSLQRYTHLSLRAFSGISVDAITALVRCRDELCMLGNPSETWNAICNTPVGGRLEHAQRLLANRRLEAARAARYLAEEGVAAVYYNRRHENVENSAWRLAVKQSIAALIAKFGPLETFGSQYDAVVKMLESAMRSPTERLKRVRADRREIDHAYEDLMGTYCSTDERNDYSEPLHTDASNQSVRFLLGLVYHAIGQYQGPGLTAEQNAKLRSQLNEDLLMALAHCMDVRDDQDHILQAHQAAMQSEGRPLVPAASPVKTYRVCENGHRQRIVRVLQGYVDGVNVDAESHAVTNSDSVQATPSMFFTEAARSLYAQHNQEPSFDVIAQWRLDLAAQARRAYADRPDAIRDVMQQLDAFLAAQGLA